MLYLFLYCTGERIAKSVYWRTDCQLAIASPMKDYEDAIMVQTAVRIGADCIVTRNLKDYKLAAFPVYSPEEFLEKLTEEHTNDE